MVSGRSLNTSATTTKTARTFAGRSNHQQAEFPPHLPVGWCLTHVWEGSTIATIGLPDLIQRHAARAWSDHSILKWAAVARSLHLGGRIRWFNSRLVCKRSREEITKSNYSSGG